MAYIQDPLPLLIPPSHPPLEESPRRNRRSYSDLIKADTAGELESKALEAARAFFGEGAELRVVRDYRAGVYGDGKTGAIVVVEEV
jgi:hypothetical protein